MTPNAQKREPKRPDVTLRKARKRTPAPHEKMVRDAFRAERAPKRPLISRERPSSGPGIGAFLLWVVFGTTAVYTLFFSEFHRVGSVEVSGASEVSVSGIEDFVRGDLSGRILGIFPRDNFFLVSGRRLSDDLRREYPTLATVSVTKRFPDTVAISVTERDRILLWCSAGPCFLIGDDGVAADAGNAERPENDTYVLRVVDTGARPIEVGEPVLRPETVRTLLSLERGLRERGGISFSPVLASPSRVSGEVRFQTTEGWELLSGLDMDPEKTVASLRLVLDREIPSERRASLRYVDLRTENRVFFAYRGEEETEASESGKESGSETGSGTEKTDKKKRD
ncbi:MAG: FtsQ-type POTRA domain-containing protein [Candidatus Moranbacteria bacterium]|nr:FtsQ-type POTRA domain-containing protein [Candidatus Moranbacteria bacterium]